MNPNGTPQIPKNPKNQVSKGHANGIPQFTSPPPPTPGKTRLQEMADECIYADVSMLDSTMAKRTNPESSIDCEPITEASLTQSRSVYDIMLEDSVNLCHQLERNLDDYIEKKIHK